MKDLEKYISENYQSLSQAEKLSEEAVSHIERAIDALDSGKVRLCEKKKDGRWLTHQWLKQAILLYFKAKEIKRWSAGDFSFLDKIPVKQWSGQEGVRVVPQAIARKGSFIESGCVLMPSYINIGAYVGSGSMIDTWATVGSCAQVGKNVHLSGGVGLGGVLEPIQANPVIIEDNVFVGSRCALVEGILIEEGAVIGAGVTLTASTKIIDVTGSTEKVYTKCIPKNSVVIPGIRMKDFPSGSFGVPTALIIGKRNENTDKKTSLTQSLRDFNISI